MPQQEKILVVEDQPHLLQGLVRIVSKSGYTTLEAATGGEALRIAAHERPNLILMDVVLPDMDGTEVCRQIKSKEGDKSPAIVLLSGMRTASDDQAYGLEIGADGYIIRPIPNRELLARLDSVLRLKRTQDEFQRTGAQLSQWADASLSDPGRTMEELHKGLLRGDHLERDLTKSESRYREIFDNAAIGLFELSPDGTFREVNAALSTMLGYSSPQHVKHVVVDIRNQLFVQPDDWDTFKELLDGEGSVAGFEVEVCRLDGEHRWISLNASLASDLTGQAPFYHGTVQDISEKRFVRALLEHSRAELAAIYEHASTMMCIVDSARTILFVNRALEEFLGKSQCQLKGGSACGVFGCVHALEDPRGCGYGPHCGDCPILSIIRETFSKQEGQRNTRTQITLADNGGHETASLMASTALIDVGHETTLLLCLEDITELERVEKALQESEQRFRATFEQAAVGIAFIAPDGRWLHVNSKLCEILGFSRDELLQLDFHDISHPHNRETYLHQLERMLVGEARTYSGEQQYVRKDGSVVWVNLTAGVVRNPDSTPSYFVGIVEDITEKRSLLTQLAQAQKLEAIGTLAGGVAHDFNNILQVVIGYSEMILEETSFPQPLRQDMTSILAAARSGADLVNQLLTFGRKSDFQPRAVQLNSLIEQLKDMLIRTLARMVSVEARLDDTVVDVNADPTQIEQVLVNLAVNAKDAMPDGGRLFIETRNIYLDQEYCERHIEARPGPHVMLSVSDTGVGMEPQTVTRIFEPFFTTKAPGEGTGLGLSMVYGIVKQHGGHITCYSEPSLGTTFEIYFPAIVSAHDAIRVDEEPAQNGGSETILIVDDEAMIRDLGRKILSKAGYTVIEASNGSEALEVYALHRKDISLVILDLMMPKMGGVQTLSELLKIDAGLRVLVATGFSASGPTKKILESGARGFVSKPFRMRDMLNEVRRVLDSD